MYRGQVNELQRTFERRFGNDIRGKIHFNTVDGFQGQEKDIIILSCVRAGPGLQTVGFLADVRRMNVALTRAKSSLFILGNAPTLERSNQDWREIVGNARSRGVLTDVDVSFFTEPSAIPPAQAKVQTQAAKPVKPPSGPPPDTLVTPHNLAESVRAKPPSTRRLPGPEGRKDAPVLKAGQKRPIPSEDHPSVTPSLGKPNLPPPKRPKKEKASIFIPKKNKP